MAINSLKQLATGLQQVLTRTIFLQTNTATGIPVPLAVLDVVKEEIPEYSADVTEHPVEEGPEVSDHVQLKNPSLRLKGLISNTPLDTSIAIANLLSGGLAAISSSQARSNLLNTGLSQVTGLAGAALQGKAANAINEGIAGAMDAITRTILLNAYESRLPFNVITKRQRYTDMVIERMSFPRDEDTGYALVFEITLKKLRIVAPLKVQSSQVSENTISSAVPATNVGAQATQAVSPQLQKAVSDSNLSASPGVLSKSPSFFGVA